MVSDCIREPIRLSISSRLISVGWIILDKQRWHKLSSVIHYKLWWQIQIEEAGNKQITIYLNIFRCFNWFWCLHLCNSICFFVCPRLCSPPFLGSRLECEKCSIYHLTWIKNNMLTLVTSNKIQSYSCLNRSLSTKHARRWPFNKCTFRGLYANQAQEVNFASQKFSKLLASTLQFKNTCFLCKFLSQTHYHSYSHGILKAKANITNQLNEA